MRAPATWKSRAPGRRTCHIVQQRRLWAHDLETMTDSNINSFVTLARSVSNTEFRSDHTHDSTQPRQGMALRTQCRPTSSTLNPRRSCQQGSRWRRDAGLCIFSNLAEIPQLHQPNGLVTSGLEPPAILLSILSRPGELTSVIFGHS